MPYPCNNIIFKKISSSTNNKILGNKRNKEKLVLNRTRRRIKYVEL